ncbi:MAG TPA: phosphatidate cytidylyltransferase [Verrucomicrobiota bacterium]|nr:phosphatidate cytidylyltransferase [Verrucomicrobiota bacterium]
MSGSAEALPPPASKGMVFARRLGSSLVLWSVVVAALFAPNRVLANACFLVILLVLAWGGMREFYGLVEKRGMVCFKGWGIFGGLLLMASTFVYLSGMVRPHTLPSKANDFETGFLVLFVLGLCVRQFLSKTNPAGLLGISTTLLGLMYVPWLLNFVQKINFFPQVDGRFYLIYFIAVTKFSDMGAYGVGSLFGRHKLIPRISPGKTWEGFAGALCFSAGASVLLYVLAPGHLTGMTFGHALGLGLLLGAAAVLGDLIESLFKREAGVKDSGRLLPGIGGVLDLLDSLLFNAPLMYLYLRHVLTD